MHWTDEEPVTLKNLGLNLPNSFAPQRSFLEIGLFLMPPLARLCGKSLGRNMETPILEIKGLKRYFHGPAGRLKGILMNFLAMAVERAKTQGIWINE
jgi:hypothetical protein